MNPTIRIEKSRDGSAFIATDDRGNILAIGRTERAARIGAEFKLDRQLARQSKYDGSVR